MSKRKVHSMQTRLARSFRSILATNHICVVNIDPSGNQRMFNWKSCKPILSRQIVDAIFDVSHNWTIYISCMCLRQDGSEYLKSVEIAPEGMHRAAQLTEVIEHYYTELRESCNQAHLVAYGWIAVPSATSLDEAQAAKLFATAGAWNQVKAA